jgi:coatomer subunit beta
VNVHQYDILLDVTVFNQTSDTLQNLSLELSTMGDLKLLERPQNYTLGPYAKKNIKANIKVSSTETGVIFGSIVYDIAGSATTEKIVQLNEIHIDIIDYITPAFTDDTSFRRMWAEFEWENKVAVNTDATNLREYLENIIRVTNMACLTPISFFEGDCGFLSANLYAKSAFDEDALANVSIELTNATKIVGFIRIRSKTQGIAISLGEKITQKQKG